MHPGVVELAPSAYHTMLVRQDGSVWSTGVYSDDRRTSFVQIFSKGATAAAAGNYYSIVIFQDASVWITGKDSQGQLSFFDGSTTSKASFSKVKITPGAKAVAAGGYHCIILTQVGHVWAVGWNKYGQLGNEITEDKTTFVKVMHSGAKAVAAGDAHSMVANEDGSVWSTGRNANGQLGDGSKTDRSSFVRVMPSGAAVVVAGGHHSMILMQDGSVCTTGWNEYGQ